MAALMKGPGKTKFWLYHFHVGAVSSVLVNIKLSVGLLSWLASWLLNKLTILQQPYVICSETKHVYQLTLILPGIKLTYRLLQNFYSTKIWILISDDDWLKDICLIDNEVLSSDIPDIGHFSRSQRSLWKLGISLWWRTMCAEVASVYLGICSLRW